MILLEESQGRTRRKEKTMTCCTYDTHPFMQTSKTNLDDDLRLEATLAVDVCCERCPNHKYCHQSIDCDLLCIHTCVRACMGACMHAHACLCTPAAEQKRRREDDACMRMRVHTHAFVHTRGDRSTNTHTCARAHARTHTCSHARTREPKCG